MLYELFDWLEKTYEFPGATAMAFISTRTALAAVFFTVDQFIYRAKNHQMAEQNAA